MCAVALDRALIYRIVTKYIGTSGGYLGGFSYATHQEFYPDFCDFYVDLRDMPGTTKTRFEHILTTSEPPLQAKILRGIVKRFPVGEEGAPESRTHDLQNQILLVAEELEGSGPVAAKLPSYSIAVVERAIADAETLLGNNGASSALDRVHTALHGFLLRVCRDSGISVVNDPPLSTLFSLLRSHLPAFQATGPRSEDITKILRAAARMLDVMSPLRNQASMAHPNENLLDHQEAMLVINVARSILCYIDTKLPASMTD